VPSSLPWHRFKKAVEEAGDPGGFRRAAGAAGGADNLGTVVDEARTGGPVAGSIKDIPAADLSKLDRYAHGANAYKTLPPVVRDLPGMPLAVTGLGAAYEGAKLFPNVLTRAAGTAGRPDYKHDPTTSKPSAGNVLNLLRGYLEGPLVR